MLDFNLCSKSIFYNQNTLSMTKFLPSLVALLLIGSLAAQAQNFEFSRRIMVTDTITDIDEERIDFAVSSDDAEQENDEIDALFDDDIDAGWEGEPEDQNILTAGMRFRNILIPQNAVIDSAFIRVWSHEDKTAEDVAEITIYGEATDSATTFTEDMLIDARPSTEAQVEWTVAEPWTIYQPYRTSDLTPIVQELVNRDGWKVGNAMAFIFLGRNQGPSDLENAREWEAFENIADPEDGGDGQRHPERVPQLVIYYTVTNAAFSTRIQQTGVVTDEDEERVNFPVSSDDAEQENDEIDALFDDDIDAGWEGEPEDQNILTAGMRFVNLPFPQGALIDSAYITVWSHEDKTAEDVAEITIYAEATDSAATFTEDMLIDARPSTEAQVEWTVAEPWTIYQPYRTPDITDLVQEIVDRPGWRTGSAMAFIFLGRDQGPSDLENAREWEAFENIADPEDGGDGQNHPERVPQLTVYFSSANTVSVDELYPEAKPLTVFPNPVGPNGVTVQLETDRPATIRLINLSGQVLRNVYTEYRNQVDLSTDGLPAGIYVLQALQNDQLYVQQLVVK